MATFLPRLIQIWPAIWVFWTSPSQVHLLLLWAIIAGNLSLILRGTHHWWMILLLGIWSRIELIHGRRMVLSFLTMTCRLRMKIVFFEIPGERRVYLLQNGSQVELSFVWVHNFPALLINHTTGCRGFVACWLSQSNCSNFSTCRLCRWTLIIG